jgi:hypothetical protein
LKNLGRFALTIGAAALFAGCGGSRPPIGAPGAVPQASAIVTRTERGGSWMLQEAKSEDLLYLAGNDGAGVFVYSYPQGKLEGYFSDFNGPQYECVDKSGDVFIADSVGSNSGVYEYEHGSLTPINFLPLLGAVGCSVDPTTGNLAVVTNGDSVYIYAHAQGSPTVYTDAEISFTADVAYDGSGDLFMDGEYQNNHFALVELPSGSGKFEDISFSGYINESIFEPILWDGKYLDIASVKTVKRRHHESNQGLVDRLQISGSDATIVGTVLLANERGAEYPQFWIEDSTVVEPSNMPRSHSYFALFKYPQGKLIRHVNMAGPSDIWGATISVGSK